MFVCSYYQLAMYTSEHVVYCMSVCLTDSIISSTELVPVQCRQSSDTSGNGLYIKGGLWHPPIPTVDVWNDRVESVFVKRLLKIRSMA